MRMLLVPSSTLKPLTKLSGGAAAEALDQIQEASNRKPSTASLRRRARFLCGLRLGGPVGIPVISEPLFQRANVKITLTPCMTLEDAKKGIDEAARRMADMQF